ELVQNEVIGRVIGISIHVLGDKPESYWYGGYTGRAQTDWRMHRDSSGGGILIMNAVHNIDYLRFITGLEVLRVYAEYDTLATSGVDVEDIISVTMRYANGAIGFIEALSCARGSYGPSQWAGDRIFGSDGTLVITQPLRLYTVREDAGFAPHQWVEVTTPPLERSDRALFIEEFVKAVASGQSPPVSGEDGLASIAVIEAAYRSNEEGHAIEPAQLMA
ncbi:MAG TPA: Gfo/Idh/MocA family oxidoreductase, partial [Armatimonadetes bacterium]|nr:Gfo/Idh/MocA family oxidoreductase [Armatimonadota bacterium]